MDAQEIRDGLEQLHTASFGWAMSCCGFDRAQAEDVLQTTYLKVMDGRARFGGRSSLKTWLFAVIRKTAAQARRRRSVRRLLLVPDPARRPDQEVEVSQQRARVQRALNSISPRQREVLDLVFFHDLTVAEAAAVMGVSVGSARVHYARGKEAVLKQLETAT